VIEVVSGNQIEGATPGQIRVVGGAGDSALSPTGSVLVAAVLSFVRAL
jgi:hypothetical protein